MAGSEKREQTLSKTVKTCGLMLKFAWSAREGRLFIVIKALMAVVNAGFSVIYTVIPGVVINELIDEARIIYLALYVVLLVFSPVISYCLNKLSGMALFRLKNEAEISLRMKFLWDSLDMDYEKLENPEIQILKRRAAFALDGVFDTIDTVTGLLSAIIGIAAMSTVISTLNPLIILLTAVLALINFITTKRSNYKKYLIGKKSDTYESRREELGYVLDFISYIKEIRIFAMKDFLLSKYVDNQQKLNRASADSYKESLKSDECGTLTGAVRQILLYAYLIYCVIKAGLSVGGLTIYISAVASLSSALSSVASSYIELSNSSLNIQDYIEFVNIPSKQKSCGHKIPEFRKGSVIEFHDVSFKYPGSDRYAVKDLNLKIRCGERLSVVGENGSGKSTFIKLLTRLYFPQDGKITLDGVNINEFEGEEYQKIFSAVFQDFNLYPFSMGENVTLSNESDTERLDTVYVRCGLDELEEELSYGSDTEVGKNIDPEGFEPSGGEGQKIAIARAIYHDAPVYLLDEPTAALDPLSEYKIYKQFNEMVGDRCAVLITHRLSAVALADKVAVFADGHVAEYGTHSELYAKGGIYRDMFDKQAEFYREA
ncbi:MAG: ABC transporter ATP-binding protein/permease [Clostridia bacterium]|nr:ABC transporter ATP-binding protein/permease [Clostridia bacterium]